MKNINERFYTPTPTLQYHKGYQQDYNANPTWTDTLNANLGYQYKSFLNAMYLESKYGDVAVDDSLSVINEIKGTEYEQYYNDLKDAKNMDHLNDMKVQIDKMKQRREILSNSSIWAQLTTGLFDPLNLVALPFGGPTLGIARSAFRVGLGVTATQAPIEVGRQLFDPTATKTESALNLGAAFFVGGTLGGLQSVAGNVRANTINKTIAEIDEFTKIVNSVDPDQSAKIGQRADRVYDITNDGLQSLSMRMNETRFTDELVEELSDPDKLVSYLKKNYTEKQLRNNLTKKNVSALAKKFEGEAQVRKLEKGNGEMKNPYNLAENIFTRSWFYRGVTNPYKRVLQNKEYSQETKLDLIKLIGDHGTALEGNFMGYKMPHSIYIKASEYESEWVKAHDQLLEIYGEITGKGVPVESKMDYNFGRKRYDQWLEDTWKKSVTDNANMTPLENKAKDVWNKFFKQWEDRLAETGHLATDASLRRRIDKLRYDLTDPKDGVITRINELENMKKRNAVQSNELEELIILRDRIRRELRQEENALKSKLGEDAERKVFKDENFFARFWNKQKIIEQREQFKEILMTWFQENPNAFVYNKKTKTVSSTELSRNPDEISKRVDEVIDMLINEGDPFNQISYGYGKSKHFRHRLLDIPNSKVSEFIIANPVQVMMTYTNRTAAQYEFYKTFGYQDPEIVIGKIIAREAKNGVGKKSLDALRRDFLHSYDRVAGIVIQNPESLSLKTAQILKDLATLNYLGSAGFSTLPDAATVLMQNELAPLFKQMFQVLSNNRVRMNAMEGRLCGEMLEILKGDVHLRLQEDMLNNPFQGTLFDTTKVKNIFFQLNLLAPMTRTFKMMSSMANSHTIIDYSIKLANGNATAKETQWLLRMGIDRKDASKINNMRKKGFIEDSDGFYLANSDAWDDLEATKIFRRTMNAGIKNTVLMGSPADKPLITDGIVYVPMRIGRFMGLTEDRRIRGYARVENAILGLPFQFYSYSFAALNKITTLYSQGAVTNRLVGIGASMALGYMSLMIKYRNNPYILDDMSLEDKMLRSFDTSGLAALYSDMYYTSIQTSLALGGPDLTMGLVSPKFPQEKDYIDAATAPLGAGVSVTTDLARGAAKFITGDYGEGTKEFLANLPGARLWFIKDQVNDMSRAIAGRMD